MYAFTYADLSDGTRVLIAAVQADGQVRVSADQVAELGGPTELTGEIVERSGHRWPCAAAPVGQGYRIAFELAGDQWAAARFEARWPCAKTPT